jgi:hypothetical protein
MTLKTVPVTGVLYLADGTTPAASTLVTATLTTPDQDQTDPNVVVPSQVTATTDASGNFTLRLWPNTRGVNGSQYWVRSNIHGALPANWLLNVLITVPDGDANTNVPINTITNRTGPSVLSDSRAAMLAAQGFAVQAQQALASAIAVAADLPNLDALSAALTNLNAIYADLTNLNAVAGDLTNVNALAAIISTLNAIAADLTNINTVAADKTNIDAVAAAVAAINTCAANITAIQNAAANAQAAQNSASSASTSATNAAASASSAQNAANAALANGHIYASTTAAQADGTLANGSYYAVPQSAPSGVFYTLYQKVSSSSSTLINTFPSSTGVTATAHKLALQLRPKRQNLSDPAKQTSGSYIDISTGNPVAAAGAVYTDYTPVTPGGSITTFPAISGIINPAGLAFYDASNTYVSGVGGPFTAGQVIAVPAGAYYVRMSCTTSLASSLVILEGSQAPTDAINNTPAFLADVLNTAHPLDLASRPKRQNLYDKDKAVTGHYIDWTTGVSTAGAAFHGDFLPVTSGGSFTLYPAEPTVNSPAGLAYYDQNQTYLSGVAGPFTSGQVFSVPVGARFVRITGASANIGLRVVLEGSQTPVDFQYHTPAFMSDAWQWHNKQFTVLGDSISDPANNATFGLTTDWPSAVAAVIGATVGLRAAKSGRTMVNALKDASDVALTSASFASIDFAILFLGTNDYGTAATPIGTINDSTATASFYGYTKKAIEQILTWKPTIKFAICTLLPRNDVTAPNAAGAVLSDYSAALRAVSSLYRIPIIDLEKFCGLNTFNFATWTVDNLHPNNAGQIACLQGPILAGLRTVWPNT